MWRKLRFQISKTDKGFETYFKWQRAEAMRQYDFFESATFSLVESEIEEYMELRKLRLKDNKCNSSLSLFERASFAAYLNKQKMNDFGYKLLEEVKQKWMAIFFEDSLDEIDKKELGIALSLIRENRGFGKAYLAKLMKVGVKTIYRVEEGESLPSLKYIYRFSKICEVTIDYITNICT